MDVNWMNLLDGIQDLRSALETWGITYNVLIGLGIAATLLLLISLREIVIWYLRISQLQAQIHAMSKQLSQLQSSVDKVQTQTQAPTLLFPENRKNSAPATETESQEAKPRPAKKFGLDH